MLYSFEKEINTEKLSRELELEFPTKFEYINSNSNLHDVFFNESLTELELGAFINVVNNHTIDDAYQDSINQINNRRSKGIDILNSIYVDNSLDKNEQFLNEYFDVILRLREGQFISAINCLNSKTPTDLISYDDIVDWANRINAI